jgi:4-hydroxybenzoate polyprenyltransferase
MNVLSIFRWPNMAIVAITMYFLRHAALGLLYRPYGIGFDLSEPQYAAFTLAIMLVAAGGYVVNDLYDHAIDLVNKPDRVVVGRLIGLRQAWWLYFGIHLAGFAISAVLAWQADYWPLLGFFPASWALLWLYSAWLKKTPFWGNLVVSVFCAGIALFVWRAEWRSFVVLQATAPEAAAWGRDIFLFYTAFALLSTLFREIVKDLEDVEGDRLYGCRTLPIALGVPTAKSAAAACGVLLLLSLAGWLLASPKMGPAGMGYGALLLAGTGHCLWLLRRARSQEAFGKTSGRIKWLMLAGLLYLPILCWP